MTHIPFSSTSMINIFYFLLRGYPNAHYSLRIFLVVNECLTFGFLKKKPILKLLIVCWFLYSIGVLDSQSTKVNNILI